MEEAANRMEICRVRDSSEPPQPCLIVASSCTPRLNLFLSFTSLSQDQLSADMFSFVAKEMDYSNYFQTVSLDLRITSRVSSE